VLRGEGFLALAMKVSLFHRCGCRLCGALRRAYVDRCDVGCIQDHRWLSEQLETVQGLCDTGLSEDSVPTPRGCQVQCGSRPGLSKSGLCRKAGMAELADAADSKSAEGNLVGVRPPLPAPIESMIYQIDASSDAFFCA
jgi:hypothetical protein